MYLKVALIARLLSNLQLIIMNQDMDNFSAMNEVYEKVRVVFVVDNACAHRLRVVANAETGEDLYSGCQIAG